MTTLLVEQGAIEVEADAAGDRLWMRPQAAEAATGWALKPEGLCRGPVCVPVPPGREAEFTAGGRIDLAAFWRHMGRPVLHDAAGQTWVLGESGTERSARLESLEAPDFTLPDLDGRPHSLSEHRGKKVFLCTWASW